MRIKGVALFIGTLILLPIVPARAAEVITHFDAAITIQPDSTIDITETITYDFGAAERHGIFRTIPVSYQARGGTYKLRVSDITVTDKQGNAYQYEVSYPGRNLEIKIGDPDRTVTGQHTYVIRYTVARALNYFTEHDELYWNVTGENWPVPLQTVTAAVTVPGHVTLNTTCFKGPSGSTTPCAPPEITTTEATTVQVAETALALYEGITIVVGFPKGVVHEPTWWQKAWDVSRDNWIVGLPLLVLLFLLHRWYTRGRDPRGRSVIVPEYAPPPNLTPSQVGTLLDEQAHTKDVSAELIELAVQGYLKIHQILEKRWLKDTTDYELEKLKDATALTPPIQRELLQRLFKEGATKVKLSTLKNSFYKDLGTIQEHIYDSLKEQGYFPHNPNTVRTVYIVIAVVIGIISFFAVSLGSLYVISGIVSAIIIFLFAFIMPARTSKGVAAREHILGLKRYLSIAEKDRLTFHNAPAKNPELFDRLLPYAMVLGVEEAWAKSFAGIYQQPPSWYSGPPGSFNPVLFTHNLNAFASTAQATLSSKPSSASGGGSGFSGGGSGGGFGGGGGGSW